MKRKYKKAFSLIEIVIVMAIIAILMSLAVPSISKYTYRANKTKILAANSALNAIYVDYIFDLENVSISTIIEKEGLENLKKELKINLNSDGTFTVSNISGYFFIEDNMVKVKINGENNEEK